MARPASVSTSTLPHPRQVDHQAVVDRAVPGGVVAAAADGDLEVVLLAEGQGGRHVVGIQAACDRGRVPVDQQVEAGARALVLAIALHEDVARERIAKLPQVVGHPFEESLQIGKVGVDAPLHGSRREGAKGAGEASELHLRGELDNGALSIVREPVAIDERCRPRGGANVELGRPPNGHHLELVLRPAAGQLPLHHEGRANAIVTRRGSLDGLDGRVPTWEVDGVRDVVEDLVHGPVDPHTGLEVHRHTSQSQRLCLPTK